jgi:hypothetical protein
MNRPEILRTLKAHKAELRRLGVSHAALFGSVARDEGGADSDIDVMLDLDRAASVTVFDYARIVEYVQTLLGGRVDVSNRETLRPHVRPSAERDAIRAF